MNISLARWAYAIGGYDLLDFDGSATKQSQASLGFGAHTLKSTFQLFAAGTYERRDVDTGSAAADSTDEGYGVQLGVRVPIRFLELQGDYKHFNFGELPDGKRNDDDRYRALVLAHLTKTTALTASYETFEQSKVDQWAVGLRFYFKTQYDVPRKKKPAAAPAAPTESEVQ